MGKTRDLFKKIRDTKGTFHAKMGTIKDRNGSRYPEFYLTHDKLFYKCSCNFLEDSLLSP